MIERFERPGHLQAGQGAADAARKIAHGLTRGGQAPAAGSVKVERSPQPRQRRSRGRSLRRCLAWCRIDTAARLAFQNRLARGHLPVRADPSPGHMALDRQHRRRVVSGTERELPPPQIIPSLTLRSTVSTASQSIAGSGLKRRCSPVKASSTTRRIVA